MTNRGSTTCSKHYAIVPPKSIWKIGTHSGADFTINALHYIFITDSLLFCVKDTYTVPIDESTSRVS